MAWHYQLVKHRETDGEVWYAVHEFYGINAYTASPETIGGKDKEEIKWMLETVLADIEKHGVKDYE